MMECVGSLVYIWWLIGGVVVGNSLVKMWWLIGGHVVVHW